MTNEYVSPAEQLLRMDMPNDIWYDWPDYLEIGFSKEHIPELIHLATDMDLLLTDREEADIWGPVHAWRVLGLLKAEDAIEPLVKLFQPFEDWDWAIEEIPGVLVMIGPAALPYLEHYLFEHDWSDGARINVGETLLNFAMQFPETRVRCAEAFRSSLEDCDRNSSLLNAILIGFLIELEAVEAAPVIEKAFERNAVDIMVTGDWEDVQIALGLLEERKKPPPYSDPFSKLFHQFHEENVVRKRKKAKKKTRQKMAKATRKKQRKKK